MFEPRTWAEPAHAEIKRGEAIAGSRNHCRTRVSPRASAKLLQRIHQASSWKSNNYLMSQFPTLCIWYFQCLFPKNSWISVCESFRFASVRSLAAQFYFLLLLLSSSGSPHASFPSLMPVPHTKMVTFPLPASFKCFVGMPESLNRDVIHHRRPAPTAEQAEALQIVLGNPEVDPTC